MGCDQSDIAPFVNALGGDSENSEQNRGNPPPHQQQARPQQQYVQPQQHYQPQSSSHQPPPQQLQKVYQGAPPSETQIKANGVKKIKKLVPRQHLEPQVNMNDDFLTHHLKYELSLTKMTSMQRIRRRQLIQHLKLQLLWGNIGGIKDLGINFQIYEESLMSSWIQRAFIDIWEGGHQDLFVKHLEPKVVRRKVCEQFMFELYEIKEYVDSGLASISFMMEQTQIQMFSLVQSSDEALYNIFQKLKDKYPQTAVTDNIDFPDVPSTKTNMNLLNNFKSLSFTDVNNMNYQTIYEDLNFLFKKAIEEEKTFKEDMQDILGQDVLACPKVGQVTKDGKTTFNACAVRRVFVKWAENLLQKLPNLKYTKTFLKFIKSRSSIINNFFFKSTIQPTTHKIVIDCISLLLELAKFDEKGQIRKEFIFNIYDLLRCKIKRNTADEIVKLLEKMKSTKTTKNGKKFQVLRVKNRFKTNNRDLLINFRYGDVLVGEAQLCIDNANVSKEAKLNYEFCHYIYELQRSIFGPTLELMMQYQDFQRPDITVSFQAEDLVPPRKDQSIKNAGPVKRKCLQGHDMISLQGNFFFNAKTAQQTEDQTIATEYSAICNYCARSTTVQITYDYCYQCGCFLCAECRGEYQKVNTDEFWLSIQKDELLPVVKTLNDLQKLCQKYKSLVVLFRLEGSSSSDLFKDCMTYNQAKLKMIPENYVPNIALINYDQGAEYQNIARKYNIADYPSLILFDQNCNPVRTVIGFSWFETPNLYMTQKLLVEGKSLDLDMYCIGCQGKMEAGQIREDSVCLNCFNTSQPINLNPQLQGYGAYCPQGHYKCMNCAYAALQCPSTYKDPMGGHYLSTNWVAPKLPKCPKGHQTKLVKRDPKENWNYVCFKCKNQRLVDDEHGMGQCSQCDAYICPKCMGAPVFSFIEMQQTPNLVRHYVESTAEQAVHCICSRHFKKSYCSRIHSLEQIQDEHNKKWKCLLCTREGNDGELHLGCFACPAFSAAMGHKFNFQICMPCATRSKMIMREPVEKVQQSPCLFVCPKDNSPMVETSFAYDKKLVIKCFECHKNYFGNTERYYCKKCSLNCCKGCREVLWKDNMPKCKQKCFNGHPLVFKFADEKSLDFCDGCSSVIIQECFKCSDDDYTLCYECVSSQPPNFVGTVLMKARESMEAKQKGIQYKGDYVEEEEDVYDQDEVNYGELGPGYEEEQSQNWGDQFNFFD